jgi:hypothetical protein
MTLSGIATRPRTTPRVASPGRAPRARWLALVSACYTLVLVTLAAPGRSLAWDESVYFSQVDPRSPAAFFSAPRSRGVSVLGAPVALFTSNPMALRVFLAVLAGLSLYASFSVWRRIAGDGTTALAALLFSSLWVSIDYGSQMMPDLWVAFAGVAAVGLFLRTTAEGPSRCRLIGLACAISWAALVRSNDGVLLAVPLLAATVLVRAWRRPAVAVAIVGGLVAGLAEWVVEAYVRFGGVAQRLADSSGIEGGMNLMWNVDNALRSANGPLLCRPCTTGSGPALLDAWWLAVPALSAVALVVAMRAGRGHLAMAVLPMVCALSVSFSYLFTISYSAPRFYLPAYALLALPIAGLLTRGRKVVLARPTRARISAALLVGVLLAGNFALQLLIAHHQINAAVRKNGQYLALADALHRLGIQPPCLVAGNSQPIAYDAKCSSSLTAKPKTDTSAASGPGVLRAARHEAVAILIAPGGHAPSYAPHWKHHALTGSPLIKGWSAYLPPQR